MSGFDRYKEIIEKYLIEYCPIFYPENIWESMKYSLEAGGKRLRPIIVLEVCNALLGKFEHAIPSACAIEMIHTYSLIHDDLPCMDNDDYRRGKLTNHKVFGEAIALLAGDALITHAAQIIIQKTPEFVDSATKLKILDEIFTSCGASGMIAGQVVDINSEGKKIDEEMLKFMHRYKTGELFRLAFRVGGILGNADKETLHKLGELALKIGLAFQIADDILDVVSTKEKLGKTPGKDEKNNKATYVTMYGLDKAKEKLSELCEQAQEDLKNINIKSELLSSLIEKIYTQTIG